MLQQPTATMVESVRPPKKFYTLGELAKEVGQDYDKIYNFVRRYNRAHPSDAIKLYRLLTTGRTLHVLAKDAEHIRAVFLHPDDYAEQVS